MSGTPSRSRHPAPLRPVLCAGELYVDVVLAHLAEPPGAGREVEAGRFHVGPGGGAAITSVALARLGHPAWLVSFLGDDVLSEMAVRRLAEEGVDVSRVRRVAGRPGNVTVALAVPEGWGGAASPDAGKAPGSPLDRAFVTYRGTGVRVPLEDLEEALAVPSTPPHVHYAGGDPVQLEAIGERVQRAGTTLSLDVGWEMASRHRGALMGALRPGWVRLLFCNEEEARALTGRDDTAAALAWLGSLVPVVVIKRGARGAVAAARGPGGAVRPVAVRAPRVCEVDPTGAGDAFCGGFLYGFLRGWSLRRCLKTAVWVGSLSTEGVGGLEGLPRLAALREVLGTGGWGPAAGRRAAAGGERSGELG